MRKFLFVAFACVFIQAANAQDGKNYILEIDGDTVHVALDQATTLKSKNGQIRKVKLSKKQYLNFSNAFLSFDYPSQYSISTTVVDEDIDQILIMTATGTGVMIQLYKTMNPEGIVDLMLQEVTADDIKAGYKQTVAEGQKTLRDGTVLKGKSSVLRMNDDVSEFLCLATGKGDKGILIMELKNDITDEDSKKLIDVFWKSVVIKL